jgi:hypothetical protein
VGSVLRTDGGPSYSTQRTDGADGRDGREAPVLNEGRGRAGGGTCPQRTDGGHLSSTDGRGALVLNATDGREAPVLTCLQTDGLASHALLRQVREAEDATRQ